MAYDSREKQLNLLLNEATDVNNVNFKTDVIDSFCTLVNSYNDGCRFATILLSKKLNLEGEWELLQTLNVLKICVEKCGEMFHREIGMFRFLNNLIKLISPKYLGHLTTNKVKEEICIMIKDWSIRLKEPKVKEAYQMLQQQNLIPESVSKVSVLADQNQNSKSKASNSITVDEKISKRLNKLLKSKCPEDLYEANQLIKSLVKEDELKIEKMVARNSELEFVSSNVQLLGEMMSAFSDTMGSQERELMNELYNTCKDKKSRLLTMAEQTNENDDLLAEIVSVHDELTNCMGQYKLLIATKKLSKPSQGDLLDDRNYGSLPSDITPKSLLDDSKNIDDLREVFGATSPSSINPNSSPALQHKVALDPNSQPLNLTPAPNQKASEHSLIDDSVLLDQDFSVCSSPNTSTSNILKHELLPDLMSLELAPSSHTPKSNSAWTKPTTPKNRFDDIPTMVPQQVRELANGDKKAPTKTLINTKPVSRPVSCLKDLDDLTQLAISKSLTEIKPNSQTPVLTATNSSMLNDEGCCLESSLAEPVEHIDFMIQNKSSENDLTTSGNEKIPLSETLPSIAEKFKDMSIPLNELIPEVSGSTSTMYDEHNFKILMCKTQNVPFPGSKVFTLTLINTNTLPIHDVHFNVQSVDPCLSRIEPETIDRIAAFNPLLPPPFSILVLYVYKPDDAWNLQTRFLVRYKLNSKPIESSLILNNIFD